MDLAKLRAALADVPSVTSTGSVRAVTGLALRAQLPGARLGDVIHVHGRGQPIAAEVVGFDGGEIVALPVDTLVGIGPNDRVTSTGNTLSVRVGPGLLGRIVDGLGRPIDGGPEPELVASVPIDRAAPPALERLPVTEPMGTGVRAIDSMLTLGVGQRIGLFAGSGIGKSTLLGSIARGAEADVSVVALVGERGREVREFIEGSLGPSAQSRSVVVVATADTSALLRLRAAQTATAVAEYFRDQGQRVLLLVDSVTRFARAQREVGLAAGEPPTRRGFPPSVFAVLPKLLERSGQGSKGSITAIYTVLVEGGDFDEPVADEVRATLDGHIVLDRELSARGHYPAISVTASISRLMERLAGPAEREAAKRVRRWIAHYESKRELISLGAYARGSDPLLDEAIAHYPEIEAFLCQAPDIVIPREESLSGLRRLSSSRGETRR